MVACAVVPIRIGDLSIGYSLCCAQSGMGICLRWHSRMTVALPDRQAAILCVCVCACVRACAGMCVCANYHVIESAFSVIIILAGPIRLCHSIFFVSVGISLLLCQHT